MKGPNTCGSGGCFYAKVIECLCIGIELLEPAELGLCHVYIYSCRTVCEGMWMWWELIEQGGRSEWRKSEKVVKGEEKEESKERKKVLAPWVRAHPLFPTSTPLSLTPAQPNPPINQPILPLHLSFLSPFFSSLLLSILIRCCFFVLFLHIWFSPPLLFF